MRAGAGLVSVAAPASALAAIQAGLLEATFLPLPQTDAGTIAADALDLLKERLAGVDAVAVGPGLGRDGETALFVRELVRACPIPLIVDADGLNAFEGRAEELGDRATGSAVLTPHLGEASRLLGRPAEELAADRIGSARSLATRTGTTVLLKGSRTVISSPAGEVRINVTGGPALATGGTGDVLTGVVSALLSRGLPPLDSASAGAFLHGVAGRLAARSRGEGTTASDVLTRIPRARAEISSGGREALA
jgi:ADP-dependent NAD(P)H-hydrate dehydratase / NAD(P)H-hydrate epimerase